jgi:hypothetical protein
VCLSNAAVEAAVRGRRVIMVGYPESFMGQTNQEFADAVEKDSGFGPHAEFFRAAIDTVLPKDQDIELWGYSTGAPIISSILKEKKYQERTTNAALLFPAASVNQSINSLKLGAVHEFGYLRKKFKQFSAATWGINEQSAERTRLHDEIMGSLMIKHCIIHDDWKSARVKEGGKIVVLSGGQDMITKSASADATFKHGSNEQIEVVDLPEAYHLSIQTEPKAVIGSLFETMAKPTTRNASQLPEKKNNDQEQINKLRDDLLDKLS